MVVSLKTEFDILMAFGVSAIVSSECVGCDSINSHEPCYSFGLDCSLSPSYRGRFKEMPPVQLKNLPPLTYAASDFFFLSPRPLMIIAREV